MQHITLYSYVSDPVDTCTSTISPVAAKNICIGWQRIGIFDTVAKTEATISRIENLKM